MYDAENWFSEMGPEVIFPKQKNKLPFIILSNQGEWRRTARQARNRATAFRLSSRTCRRDFMPI